jgi:putative transposase
VRQRALAGEMQRHYGASQRRVSMTFRFNRASLQYKPKRGPVNEALRERIKELAAARVRYGQRRIHVLLQRGGWRVNLTPRKHLAKSLVKLLIKTASKID